MKSTYSRCNLRMLKFFKVTIKLRVFSSFKRFFIHYYSKVQQLVVYFFICTFTVYYENTVFHFILGANGPN